MKALELFNAGQLDQAIESATEDVRSNPTESPRRMVLAELLCIAGAYERADRQLETAFVQSPDLNLPTAVGRQLIRAATARQRCFTEGAMPDFVSPMDAVLEAQLRLLTLFRAGDADQAQRVLEDQIVPYCESLNGTLDDRPVRGFRDLDDTTAACLEVLTTAGKYYWIAWDRIESLRFEPVKRPRDLLWREAQISVRQGPEAVVYIPVCYPTTTDQDGEAALLSRTTDWRENACDLAVGIGQRVFVAGEDEEVAILDVESLSFGD